MITEETHNLISAMKRADVDINVQAKVIYSLGLNEEILYLEYYLDIEEDGIYPIEDIWKDVPNHIKNEWLTTAYSL